MRLFIAVKFSSEIENKLIAAQNELYARKVTGNYTNCHNLHLTLAFIGEYDCPNKVTEAMKKVDFKPFSLCLSGKAGSFGDIWWVGLEKNPELFSLVSRLRKALSDYDIPFDKKPFKPHITIMRKAKPPFGEKFDIKTLKPERVSMTVSRISLMHSHRENGKLIYTEIGFIQASGTDKR